MEKLILRSVMYGADKIPDSWFEKVPGGFFKEKEANKRSSGSGGERRHSGAYHGARQYEDSNNYDDGYRSDGHRRRNRRSRSSYDGGADEEYYRDGDDRQRPRRVKSHRRRRSLDNDRYGHDDGHGRRPRDREYDDRPRSGRRQYPEDPHYNSSRPGTGGSERPLNPFSPAAYAATGAAAGAAAGAAPYPRSSAAPSPAVQSPQFGQPPQARSGSIGNGYVPYSEIYSQSTQNAPQQPFSPPPTSDGSIRPNAMNMATPVSPPPQGYQQNPLAQQHPTAADAGAGMQYTGQQGFINQDRGYNDAYDPRYDPMRYPGYDENEEPYSESPPPRRRRSRRDRSQSYDRDDSRTNDRRARSERRKDDKSKDQGRSKSRLRAAFDTSERGLGYGAVGAVTGGLLGSEFGKGAMPKAIGATLGALGANAFEARERYVDRRKPPNTQMRTQPPPPTNR